MDAVVAREDRAPAQGVTALERADDDVDDERQRQRQQQRGDQAAGRAAEDPHPAAFVPASSATDDHQRLGVAAMTVAPGCVGVMAAALGQPAADEVCGGYDRDVQPRATMPALGAS